MSSATLPPELTKLQTDVDVLRAKVASVECQLASLHPPPEWSFRELCDAELAKVIRLTKELYPGAFSVDEENDPEVPGLRYTVLSVEARGEPSQIADRQIEWHRRVAELIGPGCTNVRVRIDAKL